MSSRGVERTGATDRNAHSFSTFLDVVTGAGWEDFEGLGGDERVIGMNRYREQQILRILARVEAGELVNGVCQDVELTGNSYYQWRVKYGVSNVGLRPRA